MERLNRQELRRRMNAENTIAKLLTSRIKDLGKVCDLDPERLDNSISSTLTSEYGRINALVNVLVSKIYFPADRGDYANLSANQVLLSEQYNISIIEKIKQARGYHSFASQEGIVVKGKAPNHDMYEDYVNCLLLDLAEEAGIELPEDFNVTLAFTTDEWQAREEREYQLAVEEAEAITKAIAESKELMEQLGQ